MRSPTAEWYRRAATRDLVGHSARHVEWAAGVAADPELVRRLDAIPREHRQPSLVFSVAAYLGAPDAGFAAWRAWLLEHWSEVARELPLRRTQTNEVGRCAPLVVGLGRIPGPVAMLELGASAGLCLLPDRYRIRLGDEVVGAGPVRIESDVPRDLVPRRHPEIVWRRGLDLAPRSVADADDVRWLEALLPPDRPDRLTRLRAAIGVARADPPVVELGDAAVDLERMARLAPAGATLVVVSLGTLVYLPAARRGLVAAAIDRVGARTVTFEAPGIADRGGAPGPAVLAIDGEPIASGTPHGDRLERIG